MADQTRNVTATSPGDLPRKFKDLGDGTFAPMFALEPLSIGGGGAGTPTYTEGDVDATITGVAVMWEDTGDTLRSISAAFPLPVSIPGTVPVSGPLTDAQLRATPVPMSGSGVFHVDDNGGSLTVDGTFWQATQPVSGTVSVSGAVDTELTTADLDTGAGTDTRAVVGLVRAESGGAVLVGSANPLPVTATQGTAAGAGAPWAIRLSDGAAFYDATKTGQLPAALVGGRLDVNTGAWLGSTAPTVGQKTAANSVPVVVASDQSALDVSDRATRETGRVRIWDGTDEATVLPIRTLPATTEKTLAVTDIPNRLNTFATTIATQTPAITIGVKELLALWHANTGVKDIYIVEIWATGIVTTASTAGRSTLRVSNITTAPTGGTELTKLNIVQSAATDLTNAMQVKTGGGAVGTTFIRKLAWFATQPTARLEVSLFQASNPGNGIILPAGAAAGISIDLEREVAHTAIVDLWTVGVRWIEV